MTTLLNEFQLASGTRVILEGKTYYIKAPLDLQSILLMEPNTQTLRAVPIAALSVSDNSSSPQPDIMDIDTQAWSVAKQWQAIIAPLAQSTLTTASIKSAAQALGLSTRQIYNLVKRYLDRGSQLQALLPYQPTGVSYPLKMEPFPKRVFQGNVILLAQSHTKCITSHRIFTDNTL